MVEWASLYTNDDAITQNGGGGHLYLKVDIMLSTNT